MCCGLSAATSAENRPAVFTHRVRVGRACGPKRQLLRLYARAGGWSYTQTNMPAAAGWMPPQLDVQAVEVVQQYLSGVVAAPQLWRHLPVAVSVRQVRNRLAGVSAREVPTPARTARACQRAALRNRPWFMKRTRRSYTPNRSTASLQLQ